MDNEGGGNTASVLRVALRELAALRWKECRIHPASFSNMTAAALRHACVVNNGIVSEELNTITKALGDLCGFNDQLRIVVSTPDNQTWSRDAGDELVELHLHVSAGVSAESAPKVYLLAFMIGGTDMTFWTRSGGMPAADTNHTVVTCTTDMGKRIKAALDAHASVFSDIAGYTVVSEYRDSELSITHTSIPENPVPDASKAYAMIDTLVRTSLVECDVTLTKVDDPAAVAPAKAYEHQTTLARVEATTRYDA